MNSTNESVINIQIVHGGFIFTCEGEDGDYKTEVFTSQGKLMKAIRNTLDSKTLVPKREEKQDDKKGPIESFVDKLAGE